MDWMTNKYLLTHITRLYKLKKIFTCFQASVQCFCKKTGVVS